MSNTYHFNVAMTCQGCSGAIDRILKKADGIADYKIDLDAKKVTVTTDLPASNVLELIKKSGKVTEFVSES